MSATLAQLNTLESIIYEHASRALDSQQQNLDSLRTRTSTLLAAASLITAFLGSEALAKTQTVSRIEGEAVVSSALGTLDWLAIGAFAGVAALSLVILWPWTWDFKPSPKILIADHAKRAPPPTISEFHLFLATTFERSWDSNQIKLLRLFWVFRVGILCLASEVLIWLVALGTR